MTGKRDSTLEELGEKWGDPSFASCVAKSCHSIRRKTDEELRLAIGQQMGLGFLMPLAIDRLKIDFLAAGDMYEGALLKNVLGAAPISDLDPNHLLDLDSVVQNFMKSTAWMDAIWQIECLPAIQAALNHYDTYRKRLPPQSSP